MDIVRRVVPPVPWADGEKIPWHQAAFSRRMLEEHLSQEHDAASRRGPTIDRQVAWIHEALLGGRPTRVLDLGCGPGLYTARLAALGHTCVGIDVSPASIEYARAYAQEHALDCRYVLGDVRDVDLGGDHELVLCVFGEINVFRPADAGAILRRAGQVLGDDGVLLLEAHTFQGVQALGASGSSFSTHSSGLFGDAPYMQLSESFWDASSCTATTRWWIVDVDSGYVTLHAQTMQAYADSGYAEMLQGAGFEDITQYASLEGDEAGVQQGLFALAATRRPGCV
ncbi:MAG: methyltransferase domain-containing protein [Planctomycetota bacterium]